MDSLGFYLFQTFTALILILAANTSFAAFPRLAAILAEDYFFPRNFAYRGDRLAYTAGIIVLAGIAALLLIAFGGDTHALIPLYSVGVFLAFTLSQSGMVRHWWHDRVSGWRWRLSINAIGALMTATVLVVVLISKAPQSLLVAVIIPIIVAVMWFIHHEYDTAARGTAHRPREGLRQDREAHSRHRPHPQHLPLGHPRRPDRPGHVG